MFECRRSEIFCNLVLSNPQQMKRVINIIVFFLTCSIAYAQDLVKTRDIISDVIDVKNITYEDRVDKVSINSIRKAIQLYKADVFYSYKEDSVFYIDSAGKKKIVSFWDVKRLNLRNYHEETIHIKSDSIKFTESEIKYINDEIATMDRHKWDKGLFADALLIPSDKINKIFTANIFKGWVYLKAKHIYRLYSFAPPIFLRDDTYCLFYYHYGCGDLCGQSEFALYKKEQGKWVKIMPLSESVS